MDMDFIKIGDEKNDLWVITNVPNNGNLLSRHHIVVSDYSTQLLMVSSYFLTMKTWV